MRDDSIQVEYSDELTCKTQKGIIFEELAISSLGICEKQLCGSCTQPRYPVGRLTRQKKMTGYPFLYSVRVRLTVDQFFIPVSSTHVYLLLEKMRVTGENLPCTRSGSIMMAAIHSKCCVNLSICTPAKYTPTPFYECFCSSKRWTGSIRNPTDWRPGVPLFFAPKYVGVCWVREEAEDTNN